ncbi:hypothetical protein D3C75_1103880 [compost metagenome]
MQFVLHLLQMGLIRQPDFGCIARGADFKYNPLRCHVIDKGLRQARVGNGDHSNHRFSV